MNNFDVSVFEPLLGRTIVKIEGAEKDSEEILFTLENGDIFRMYHEQDCCEDVRIEDIGGDINNLIGNPVLLAEEVTNEGEVEYGDTCTWTWYHFATIKGYVTIRWYGGSNGYYSESVDHEWIKKEDAHCDWIEELPYSELITGPSLKDIPISNEIMEEAKRRVREELNAQWDKFYEMHSGHENAERAVFRIRREDVDAETWDALMKATQEGKSFHIFEKGKPFEVVPIKEDC